MRKVIVLFTMIVFLMPVQGFSAGEEGACVVSQVYGEKDNRSMGNKVGDWFATRGKAPEEQRKILKERKMERAVDRKRRKAEKEGREMRDQAEGRGRFNLPGRSE